MARAKIPAEVEVDVESLNAEGLGQAQWQASEQASPRRLLMRNALPGETVSAKILRRRKGKIQADASPIANFSSDRKASVCRYFPRCGGCVMHHMELGAQLSLKQGQLAAALAQHGVQAAHWHEPYSAGRTGYRRKARLGVRKVGEQVFVGFRESFSNRVARLDECLVLTPELSRLIKPLKALISQLSIADQIPQIEFAQGAHSASVMVRHLAPLSAMDRQLWQEFDTAFGVEVLLQSGGYDTLVTLAGAKPALLGYQIPASGIYMQFQPQQFTQVNLPMNLALIKRALAYLGDLKGKRVADLFCGIGNFTLPLARAGAEIWGYEVAADAIAMATANADLNNLHSRAHFNVLDLYGEGAAQALPAAVDALVLDPPRSGAGPNLSVWLGGFHGKEIVYVSCNPVSFAADARAIVDAGFELVNVGIFDMFPNTAHVETMAFFRRRGRADG